jgi:sugar lactone lactonase YvrE
MTDENELYEDYEADARANRTRTALIAILVVLVLMLAGLAYFITRVVTPPGAPQGASGTPVGIEWVRSLYGYGPKPADQLYRPLGAAVGPDGTIYGADTQRARIIAFGADGAYKSLIHTGPESPAPGRLWRPDKLATDPDGNVYIADGGNQKVIVFSSAGRFLREWAVPSPTGVRIVGDRAFVLTAQGVAVCKTDGTLLSLWGRRGKGPEEFDNPQGFAIAEDGTVYISDTLNARIKAYTPEGRLLWVWPEDRRNASPSGLRPSTQSGPLQLPSGMCIDGRGRIVLVDPFNFQIMILQPSAKSAKLVARYGQQGAADGYFYYPSDIAYDAARDWFVVADTRNNRLQVVRIPGSASNVVLAGIRRATTGLSWLCALPLLLILAAIAIAVLRRRSRGLSEEADETLTDGVEQADR